MIAHFAKVDVQSKTGRLLLSGFFVFLLTSCPCFTADSAVLSSAQEDALRLAETQGHILSETEDPAIQAMLSRVFEDLSNAQRRLFSRDKVSFNSIHLIDSPIPNAFVMTADELSLGPKETHLVIVTTGLIGKLFPASGRSGGLTKNDLNVGRVRLAGILAHELSHPQKVLSNVEAKTSLIDRYVGNPAVELAADIGAASILEEANYPRDATLEALKVINSEGGATNKLEVAKAALSAYPSWDLRLAASRMTVTQLDSGHGKQVISQKPFSNRSRDRADSRNRSNQIEKSRNLFRTKKHH